MSRIVVLGGTGLIGSKVVKLLTEHGHEAVPASPNSGVNALTGEGLAEVLAGADTVLDVSNSPSFEADAVMAFFTTATANLLEAAETAGVSHYVALSIVGAEGMHDSGYMRAKVAQEKLIRESSLPYSIVHATQFYEFVTSIAAGATVGDDVRLPNGPIRPLAGDDAATAVARVAAGAPLHGTIEVAGPEVFGLDELIRVGLAFRGDARTVVTDPDATYFGEHLGPTTLLPGADATIFELRFADWLPLNPAPAQAGAAASNR